MADEILRFLEERYRKNGNPYRLIYAFTEKTRGRVGWDARATKGR